MIRVADLLAGAGVGAATPRPATRRGSHGLPVFVRVAGVDVGRVLRVNSTAALVRLGDTPELEERGAWMRSHYPTWSPPEWSERWFALRLLSPA